MIDLPSGSFRCFINVHSVRWCGGVNNRIDSVKKNKIQRCGNFKKEMKNYKPSSASAEGGEGAGVK